MKALIITQFDSRFLREVSRATAHCESATAAFLRVGEIAAATPGIVAVQVVAHLDALKTLFPSTSFGLPIDALATAPTGYTLKAGGRCYGQLQLFTDPSLMDPKLAAATARFLAQQMAILLSRIELDARCEQMRKSLEATQEDLRLRKALSRAVVLIAKTRGMPEESAQKLIEEQSRRTGKSVTEIAEAILLANSNRLTGPTPWTGHRLRRTA
jgi:hypothetical protein